MRSDEEAELFFKIVSKKALDYPLINNAALPLKRKRPNYGSFYNYFQVEGYGNNANTYYPTTPEKYFRQQYFQSTCFHDIPQIGATPGKYHSRQKL